LKRTSGRKKPEFFPERWRINEGRIGAGDFLPFSRHMPHAVLVRVVLEIESPGKKNESHSC
jgi:hypothetical protein